jgi:hypothetical protein
MKVLQRATAQRANFNPSELAQLSSARRRSAQYWSLFSASLVIVITAPWIFDKDA